MSHVIQSAWGIIYYLDQVGEPRYLLIKRHALSGKIEWLSPKGKVQPGEETQVAALREVSEESGIPINQLFLKVILGTTQIRMTDSKGGFEKDVTYFLMQFTGDPEVVHIAPVEGYVGIHKWATLQEVLGLVYYQDVRELIRKSYLIIKQGQKDNDVKKQFLDSLA